MAAGKMDQRITIQAESRVPDGGGGFISAWATVAERWAEVWPASGRERSEAMQMQAAVLVRFRIDQTTPITEADRIVWAGRFYNVRAIARGSSRERCMVVDAEAGVAP